MNADDMALLLAWREGDAAAGGELFSRYFKAMRRFFRSKLSPEDVEDAVQGTFLACAESKNAFRGESSFRTYLFTVARHQLYRVLRKRKTDVVAAGIDFGVTSLRDLGVSPSAAFAKNEEERIVVEALKRLPVDQQVLLELYYWHGMSGPDLAQILEVADATVRTRLHRARGRLREVVRSIHAGRLPRDVEETARGICV